MLGKSLTWLPFFYSYNQHSKINQTDGKTNGDKIMTNVILNEHEIQNHYDFYCDNCSEDEIPLSLQEWKDNYLEDLKIILG